MTAADRELDFAPTLALAEMVRARRISPAELMDYTLARIADVNPRLGAFVALDEDGARVEAARQAERLARGEDLGPLGGVPFGVKDLEDVTGLPTTHGSRAFRDAVAASDSVQVERLRAAGAIPVGKTNTPEFGYTAFSANDLFPPSRNPWALDRTPGGSSGGSAAAVAGGMVALATATDGAGSVRIPSAFVGAFGLKTSFGRIPLGPRDFLGWLDTTVYGPITRTVTDAAAYLDAVCGAHPADPDSLPHPGRRYRDRLDEPLPRLRVAYSRTLDGATHVQADVAREVDRAVEAFRELGHEVVDREVALPALGLWWARMAGFERTARLWDVYLQRREEIGEGPLRAMDAALGLGPEEFGQFARQRAELNEALWRLFDEFDLLLTPTVPYEAFAAEGPVPTEVEGREAGVAAFTVAFNLSGHPAATVRAGFTDGGLPAGLHIVGPRHRDDLVLQASLAYERARPWADRWPEV